MAGYALVECYIKGLGVEADPEKGVSVLKKAIEMNCDDLEGAKNYWQSAMGLVVENRK